MDMKIKSTILTALILSPFFVFAQVASSPKLVVGIVVDQMSYDYLYRYWDNYGDGGFKRLVNNGYSCEDHHFNYIPTYTAPGHASIYTGSVPAVHGIISNDWYEVHSGGEMYCVGDSTVHGVGTDLPAGKKSPANMLSTSICDALKMASGNQSKVIGVSLKDRGAILPAGHTADAAYWFDGKTNAWISSSYYMERLPDWVTAFNAKLPANDYMAGEWNLLLPANRYKHSTADDVSWEYIASGESHPVFPHRLSNASNMEAIKGTPFGNSFTTDFAIEALAQERLGMNPHATDMLCLSYSSTDYVGHAYGPHAMETEDTYLRLDIDIARLLDTLDATIGKGNYLVFLTADHGVTPAPGYMQSLGIPTGLMHHSSLRRQMDSVLYRSFGVDALIRSFSNNQVFLDHAELTANNITASAVAEVLYQYLMTVDGIANVIDLNHISDAKLPDRYKTMVINGVHAKRSGDIEILYAPNWMDTRKTGTTHGSMYQDDTHVPLLWYGWNIPVGKTWRRTEVTDIAATLAAMLRIPAPNGCIGNIITELQHR